MTGRLHFHFSLPCIGEGNGNPLQRFCLESPRDGGAWWAAVSGVAQSWTRLKRRGRGGSSSVAVVQSLSCVWLSAAPWTAAHQAPLSFTISWNLLKLMSIKLVMPSNHLTLCYPLLLSNYLCAKQPIWLYLVKYLFDVFTHVIEVLIVLILMKSTLSSFSLWLYFLCPKKCLPTLSLQIYSPMLLL